MIQTVPLAALRASPLNPRKRFDDAAIDELAESIHTEGLLQNLVVRPSPDDPDKYEIAAGERRLRAMLRLDNQGRWPRDRLVPVVVRDLTDLQLLQLATTENLARADMTPIEEARAFQRMLELGSDVETIALETGLSERTVKTRLALAERLVQPAIEMLEAGEINLSQAQALTTASDETQVRILNSRNYQDEFYMDASDIRRAIANTDIPVSRAKFPLPQYTGTFTEPSIFDPDGEATFDDVDQFHRLQKAWKDKLVDAYKKSWAWVEETDYYSEYRYDKAERGEGPKTLGVVIEWNPHNGTLKVHEGLKKRKTEFTGRSSPKTAEKDPLALSQRHHAVINQHRTRALQTAVLEGPDDHRLATVVSIIGMLHLYWSDSLIRTDAVKLENASDHVQEIIADYDKLLDVENLLDLGYRYQARHERPTALMRALLERLNSFQLRQLQAALIALHVQAGGEYQDSARMDPTTYALWQAADPADHLPTWRELGSDWLQLYPKARLEQLHQEATGLESEGLTRKAMIAGILDHARPGWLDQVPPELAVQAPALIEAPWEDPHGVDGQDEDPYDYDEDLDEELVES